MADPVKGTGKKPQQAAIAKRCKAALKRKHGSKKN